MNDAKDPKNPFGVSPLEGRNDKGWNEPTGAKRGATIDRKCCLGATISRTSNKIKERKNEQIGWKERKKMNK